VLAPAGGFVASVSPLVDFLDDFVDPALVDLTPESDPALVDFVDSTPASDPPSAAVVLVDEDFVDLEDFEAFEDFVAFELDFFFTLV
jgi:hypothetical protein